MTNKGKMTYKQLEQQLSDIVARVEDSSYDELDDLLKDYDKGMAVIDELTKKLKTAKNKIIKSTASSKDQD